ncbi:MAG TPA: RIP metalloprotease RseP [Longimicrobiales bacterium]|nr:RIP metalloprotease RseP [Longimicrobiales bacterium]
MLTIIAFIFVLGVLIFVHELGHFMTAKAADIEVPRFSIGFGPRILGFKRGETEYVISLLPLGGYVKMAGMEEMEQIEGGPATVNDTVGAESEAELDEMTHRPHRPRDFESKSLPWRTLVISAGVIMNLLFAFVVFSFSAGIWGVPADPGTSIGGVVEERLTADAAALTQIQPGAVVAAINDQPVTSWREMGLELTTARAGETRITFENHPPVTFNLPSDDEEKGNVINAFEPALPADPVLEQVIAGGPADQAGLEEGDRVVQAGGRDVATWQEFIDVIERSPGSPVPLVIDRDGEQMQLTITPEDRVLDSGLRVGRIEVSVPDMSVHMPRVRQGPLRAVAHGARQTWDVTALTLDFLGGMVTGRHSARNIGGPIMIGEMSGRFARAGAEAFLGFMAILSVNLAVLNLLPIPVLDGGHLVFLGAEAIRGRPLSIETRMRATQVGFVFIILLMTWAVGNDVLRVFGL